MGSTESSAPQHERDAADLKQFGYEQELHRSLGPVQLVRHRVQLHLAVDRDLHAVLPGPGHGRRRHVLDLAGRGHRPAVRALNFAELSSHYPVAGSVFQWTKYLSAVYAWFTGWIYLFAGVITVAAVCATLPIALIPALNSMFGWSLNNTPGQPRPAVDRDHHARRSPS
jgi:hypothetical protein